MISLYVLNPVVVPGKELGTANVSWDTRRLGRDRGKNNNIVISGAQEGNMQVGNIDKIFHW